ncbi:MAG: Hsp20/alpha crystallin family protein [Deltaproteobacteria bacterium]|nr:MAG: Hsp20/alpha crystallin family protein [Deltaproteobacteria bacterium]
MLTLWNDRPNWRQNRATLDALRREFHRQASHDETAAPRQLNPTDYPRIGLFDTAEQLVLRAEVPGLAEEDLDITIEQETLTLRGTRKIEIPEGYTVHRQERAETTFARSFHLPCKVDSDKTAAVLKDGLLTVTLPKAPEVHARQISVKSV